MVALKLIISAALLSQASVFALPIAVTKLVDGKLLQVSEPVLAVRPGKHIKLADVASAALAPTTTSVTPRASAVVPSVEATGILGKLIVGDPVLAVRLEDLPDISLPKY